jgi:hypothetical protein
VLVGTMLHDRDELAVVHVSAELHLHLAVAARLDAGVPLQQLPQLCPRSLLAELLSEHQPTGRNSVRLPNLP